MDSVTTSYASVFRPGCFDGQVILVTGGGTGIGRAVAHELASLGAIVVLAARRPEPLEATADEIADAGGQADTVALNLREDDSITACADAVVERHGRIDGLVNNAGGQFPSPAEDIRAKGWRTVVDLNLNGTFLMTQAVHAAWMGANGGAVVNVIAEMWNGFPFMSHTGAARAGVDNLTKSLAVEWGPAGIRVNAVAPGTIYSSGMDTYDPQFVEMIVDGAAKVPAGRVGTESETAAAITFLLSPAAAYISGATLKVDGGSSLAKNQMRPLVRHDRIPPYDGFHLSRELPDAWRAGDD